MANVITNNIPALNTLRNLNKSNSMLSSSLQKLSSGFRINTGKDGPADLVISEKLRAQTIGLQRAVQNTQEAQNVLGIAEGALNEMNEILKTMRSLALHAANSGITAPEQVAADQAEVDSAIQTIDRIANTTRYSDQFLLNGNQALLYDRNTVVAGTSNNALLDVSASELKQVFKTDNFNIDITFNGTDDPDSSWSIGDAEVSKQAMKAYFEIDSASTDAIDVDTDGRLTKSQNFTLSGTKGSKQFSFDVGATMGQIASAIDSVADSTGVDATLIFASDQTFTHAEDGAIAANLGGGAIRTAGAALISGNYNSAKSAIIGTTASTLADNWVMGWNTDGEGKVYIKVTGNDTYELYKDQSLSAESLIGHGTDADGTQSFAADNESGLSAFDIGSINSGNAGEVVTLNLFGIEGDQLAGGTATVDYTGSFSSNGAANTFDEDLTFASGVRLGENTDAEGKIYFKTVMSGGTTGTVYAYNNARMSDEDLVAQTQENISLAANQTIVLSEIRNSEDTAGTGLNVALSTVTAWSATSGDEFTGTMSFNNLGVRVSSQEYGSDQYVRLQQDSGTVFQYYEQADSSSATLVDSATGGVTVQRNGQDATLTVNGQRVQTDGLSLELSTQDVTASLTLNEGSVGSTTIAQVGYDVGSFATMAGALTYADIGASVLNTATNTVTGMTDVATKSKADLALVGAVMFNSGHSSLEQLTGFNGGMQLQLGEGAGDQERTVYSVESMAVANMGKVSFTDAFEDGSAVIETRTLSLQDVLGGGSASLASNPTRALEIIDQAIDDVSTLRARLGATQKNLLQTNANSLNVAIENITATESDIRDANMAQETTEFTKNQILVQAGTAMLAQANTMSQSVLQLLG